MTQESRVKLTQYEDRPEWDRLTVTLKRDEWEVSLCNDGDVEVCCSSEDGSGKSLFLNQTELRQVVEFLQSKLV